jgi:hypothetical protein
MQTTTITWRHPATHRPVEERTAEGKTDQLRRCGLRGLGSVAMPVTARSAILV